jgi:disulfide bond formation protein DsbB
MARRELILIAAGGSFLLLAGAFLFQGLGFAPCPLCLWQRWPHAAAVGLGILGFVFWQGGAGRLLALAGALAALATAGLGLYHTGVERGWWEGPASCAGGAGLGGLSGADLLSLEGPSLILCTDVAWSLFGLSMASWNAVLSLLLAAIWVMAARRPG